MISTFFLELTNHCNMNCDFCANHLMDRPHGYMSVDLAKNIIDQLKEMEFKGSLITSLMGEPLLHSHFKEILTYSISAGVKTNVITNFLLVSKHISTAELLTSGIDILCLSYQTPNEATFTSRKTNISFENYFNKLENILIYIRENPIKTRRVEIHLLQSFYNYLNTEVINDYMLIESTIMALCEVLNQNRSADHMESLRKKIARSIKNFRRGKQYLDSFDIKIGDGVYAVLKRANTWANCLIPDGCRVVPQKTGRCGFFHSALGVLWDGKCTVCCQDFDGQIIVGDVNLNSIQDIWNGEILRQLRAMEKEGVMINKYCQICKGNIEKNGSEFSIVKRQDLANHFFQFANRVRVKLFG